MSRRRHLALGAALVAAVAAAGGAIAARGGDPAEGALVWQEQQCGSCHTFARAGSAGTAGPSIDRWLAPHAAHAGLPLDRFALSRVTWGGRGMPAYGPQLTPEQVDDVVSFLLGRPFTAPAGGVPRVRGFDPPPRTVTANRATVARWVKTKRLRGAAVLGARVFAREGCLSCHRYLGSGVRKLGAPDLTAIGKKRRAVFLERYVARPYRFGNTLMPTYADVSAENLRRVAAFLAASR